MNCQTVRNALSGFLDQELAGAERIRVEGHLAQCRVCAAHFAELSALRGGLQSLPVMPVPQRLRVELRIAASRARARASSAGKLPLALQTWVVGLRLAIDNLMRPLALPFAGGLLSALLLFGVLVPVLGFRPAVRNDVPTMFYTPVALVEVTSLGISEDEAPVVELSVDAKGQATDANVLRGQLSREEQAELSKMMFFSRFTPATWFGQPTSGKVVFAVRRVHYTVRG